MDTCIFCKIAAGEIPSYKVYEDEYFVGFLDAYPISKGHALLVPKKHYRWTYD
ncbi:MAG: HIT domain-containing protein, partial [Microgenomates group bacterium]